VVPGSAVALAGDDFPVQVTAGSGEVLVGEEFLESVRLVGLGQVGSGLDGFDVIVGYGTACEVADGDACRGHDVQGYAGDIEGDADAFAR
jgi:hypothetical protein